MINELTILKSKPPCHYCGLNKPVQTQQITNQKPIFNRAGFSKVGPYAFGFVTLLAVTIMVWSGLGANTDNRILEQNVPILQNPTETFLEKEENIKFRGIEEKN